MTSTTKTVNAAFSKSATRGKYSNDIIQNEFAYVFYTCLIIDTACKDLM